MDHLDSSTCRNGSQGGHILDTYTDAERARIRAVLLDYAKEKQLSVEKLFKALCLAERSTPETVGFSFKTFQRFLANTVRVGDEVVAACARFAKTLPNRPTALDALGEALLGLYKTPLPADIAGNYTLTTSAEGLETKIVVSPPANGFALVKETRSPPLRRLHDGVLVSMAKGEYLIFSRDRLLLSLRYITTMGDAAFVYDHAKSPYLAQHPGGHSAVFIKDR
jgi:hypothetical protein